MCLMGYPVKSTVTFSHANTHRQHVLESIKATWSYLLIALWIQLHLHSTSSHLPHSQSSHYCPLLLLWFLLVGFSRLSRNLVFVWNSWTMSWSLLSSTLGKNREDFWVLRVLKLLLGRPFPLIETYQSLSALALRLLLAPLGTVRYKREA